MTTHIVGLRKLKDIVAEAIAAAEKRIDREAKRAKFSEDQTRQAKIEGYSDAHGQHLGDRDRKRRERRAIHHGSTAATCGEPSSKMSPIWDGVTCERCLALRMRSAK